MAMGSRRRSEQRGLYGAGRRDTFKHAMTDLRKAEVLTALGDTPEFNDIARRYFWHLQPGPLTESEKVESKENAFHWGRVAGFVTTLFISLAMPPAALSFIFWIFVALLVCVDLDIEEFLGWFLPGSGVLLIISLVQGDAENFVVSVMEGGMVGTVVGTLVYFWLKDLPGRREKKRQAEVVQNGVNAYYRGDPDVVWQVHNFAVAKFREWVAAKQNWAMGPGSELARERARRADQLDDARRSMAYWRERLKGEPSNELAKTQLDIAGSQHAKFRSALSKVDVRVDKQTEFYSTLNARVAAMEQCNRDFQESKRLEDMSEQADEAGANAHATSWANDRKFVQEATEFNRMLTEFNRVQNTSLAGIVPLSNIERVADQINESSDSEKASQSALERAIEA